MMNIGQILFVGSEIFCFVFYFYIGTLFGLSSGVLFIWTFLRKFRLVAEDWEGWQVQGWMMDIGQIFFFGVDTFLGFFLFGIF